MALIASGTSTLNPTGRTWQRVCASTLQPPLVKLKTIPPEIPEEGAEVAAAPSEGDRDVAVLPNTGDAHDAF